MTPHSPATDLAMHTAEPWAIHADEPRAIVSTAEPNMSLLTVDQDGYGMLYSEADARRIVAAINACAGIPTEVLECDTPTFIAMLQERHSLRLQRDDLLAALKALVCESGGTLATSHRDGRAVAARAALARAEGREVKG